MWQWSHHHCKTWDSSTAGQYDLLPPKHHPLCLSNVGKWNLLPWCHNLQHRRSHHRTLLWYQTPTKFLCAKADGPAQGFSSTMMVLFSSMAFNIILLSTTPSCLQLLLHWQGFEKSYPYIFVRVITSLIWENCMFSGTYVTRNSYMLFALHLLTLN